MDAQTTKQYMSLLAKPDLTPKELSELKDIAAAGAIFDSQLAEQRKCVIDYMAAKAKASGLADAEAAAGQAAQALKTFDDQQTTLGGARQAERQRLCEAIGSTTGVLTGIRMAVDSVEATPALFAASGSAVLKNIALEMIQPILADLDRQSATAEGLFQQIVEIERKVRSISLKADQAAHELDPFASGIGVSLDSIKQAVGSANTPKSFKAALDSVFDRGRKQVQERDARLLPLLSKRDLLWKEFGESMRARCKAWVLRETHNLLSADQLASGFTQWIQLKLPKPAQPTGPDLSDYPARIRRAAEVQQSQKRQPVA